MGSLSNLYISQSYQSLIHLATNNTASATLIGLEDGLGNSIGVSVNTAGNLYLSGTFSASLQEGYLYVGNASGRTIAFPTSSLVSNVNTSSLVTTASFNAYTASTDIRLSNIELTTASVLVSISNLNASSASQQISIDALNVFTASQSTASIVSSITQLNQFTQSADIRLNNLETTSASVNTSLSNINAYTQSNDAKWQDLGNKSGSWITESETGSFARYDVSNPWSADQTFTNITATSASFTYVKTIFETASVIYSSGSNQLGDELTDVQTLSGSVLVRGGLFVNDIDVTSSLNSINVFTQSANIRLNNLESTSASVNISISNLNTFTASNGNTSLNQYTASNDQKWSNLAGQSGSWVTSNITASSLVTASVSLNTITFTKGDNTTFNIIVNTGSATSTDLSSLNAFTASQETKNTTLENVTASLQAFTASQQLLNGTFATTGSNTFTGQQNIQNFLYIEEQGNPLVYTQFSQDTLTNKLQVNQTGASGIDFNTNVEMNELTASLTEGYVWAGGVGNVTKLVATSSFIDAVPLTSLNEFTASTNARLSNIEATTASLLIETQNLELFTASANSRLNNIESKTGSYATTGSNVFTGDQTLTDSAGNAITLSDVSGSLLLVGKGFTSASAHFLSAPNTGSNIIIKNDNNATTTVISGSYNIIANQAAATTGFTRLLGNQNLALSTTGIPQVSSSMASTPWNFFRNVWLGATTIRGPISSSQYTYGQSINIGAVNLGISATQHFERAKAGLNFNQNTVLGTLNYVANTTDLTQVVMTGNSIQGVLNINAFSSSVNMNNTLHNGQTTISSSYVPPAGAATTNAASAIVGCFFYGNQTNVFFSGSNTATNVPRQMVHSGFIGSAISASLNGNGDNSHFITTFVAGHSLRVTGSNTAFGTTGLTPIRNDYGSVFLGRFNAQDGNRAKTAETVLAVGTGTSGSAKTGFLIDSGSNTFIEGTLNVSGSSTLSGSLYIQSGSTLPNTTGSAILTWNPTTGQVAQASFAQINSASLSLGGWQDTTTQSGSADTAYAFKYNTTDFQDGIILSGSTGLQITKKGTYDLQWSGQLVQGASSGDVTVWLRKNGTNIDGTAGRVTMASNTKLLPAWNYLLDLNANDVIELMWGSTSENSTWEYIPAATIYPAAASIIVTLSQQR